MIKRNGHYFIFGSHLTGWSPNDNVSHSVQDLMVCTDSSLDLQLCGVLVRSLV